MEPKTVRLEFPDTRRWRLWHDISCDVEVVPLGGQTYRMQDVSSFIPLQFNDEFLAQSQTAENRDVEVLLVRKRTAKSGYQRWSTIGAAGDLQQGDVAEALHTLESAGGHWAVEFGGVFVATWPPGFDFESLKRSIFGGADI